MNTAHVNPSLAATSLAGEAPKITIVLPTRNRPELAIATIRSLLHQLQPNTLLIVSDNSTKVESRAALCQACQNINSPAVRYQTPLQPLPMAEHWEWAIDRALTDPSGPTHVMIATDRMLFYRNALALLRRVLSAAVDDVVCYNNDSLVDIHLPVRLERRLWSGSVAEFPS
jgi:GT2 family glycosyltransferase